MKGHQPMTAYAALRKLETGRPLEAFRELKVLAERGDEHAYHMLGYLYDVGEGTRRDRKKALHWYLRGYSVGNSSCATNIATIYRDAGESRKEFQWYSKAMALGDGDAELEVAIRLLSGKGVRRNLRRAIHHLKSVVVEENTSEDARDVARQILRGCQVVGRAA